MSDDCKETQTPDIPYHLVMEEILPRLPVKALLRFRCVCKNWLYEISSDKFKKSHLRLSSPSYQVLMFAESSAASNDRPDHLLLLNYDQHSEQKQLVDFGIEPVNDFGHYHDLNFVGCCNGIVCLVYRTISDAKFFRIWNPATRAYRDIVPPQRYHISPTYGFGYVSSTDDYRILSYFTAYKDNQDVELCVFSSRTGVWKRVLPLFNTQRRGIGRAVWVGDKLFWLIGRMKCNLKLNAVSILSFDMVSEQLIEIPWSMDSLNELYFHMELFVINGRLSLSCHYANLMYNGPDFWVLTQPGVWNSWQKLFSLGRGMNLLTVFDNGECLVGYKEIDLKRCRITMKLSVIDPTQDSTKQSQSCIDDVPYFVIRKTWNYVESLVSPFGATNANEYRLNYEIKHIYNQSNETRRILSPQQKSKGKGEKNEQNDKDC